MSKVISCDLGSCGTLLAVIEGGKPTVIVNQEGERVTPSVISFANGERKIGSSAKRQQMMYPKETVTLIKRFMGCTYDEAKELFKHVQYDFKNKNGYPVAVIGDKEFTPEELSAMLLKKVKDMADEYYGNTQLADSVVITVPANYSNSARESVRKAAIISGLVSEDSKKQAFRIINEPTAAILYAIDTKKDGKYMVADYGGKVCTASALAA